MGLWTGSRLGLDPRSWARQMEAGFGNLAGAPFLAASLILHACKLTVRCDGAASLKTGPGSREACRTQAQAGPQVLFFMGHEAVPGEICQSRHMLTGHSVVVRVAGVQCT